MSSSVSARPSRHLRLAHTRASDHEERPLISNFTQSNFTQSNISQKLHYAPHQNLRLPHSIALTCRQGELGSLPHFRRCFGPVGPANSVMAVRGLFAVLVPLVFARSSVALPLARTPQWQLTPVTVAPSAASQRSLTPAGRMPAPLRGVAPRSRAAIVRKHPCHSRAANHRGLPNRIPHRSWTGWPRYRGANPW